MDNIMDSSEWKEIHRRGKIYFNKGDYLRAFLLYDVLDEAAGRNSFYGLFSMSMRKKVENEDLKDHEIEDEEAKKDYYRGLREIFFVEDIDLYINITILNSIYE